MLPSQKYTIRTELVDKENTKGLYPVKIIVSIKGKRAHFSTGIRIKKIHWDEISCEVKPTEKMYRSFNAVIEKKRVEIEQHITDKLRAGQLTSIEVVKNSKDFQIVQFMDQYIKRQTGKYKLATIKRYKVEMRRIKNFSPSITFASLDSDWLRRYEDYLKSTPSERTEKIISNNTIHGCFKVLRRIFNAAIRDGITKNYPFTHYDNPKYHKTNPVYLTAKEIELFEKALNKPLEEKVLITGKYFLLGCYSGLRVSDWMRFNKEFIEGDRLILRAKKNGEIVAMKMHSKLKVLVKELLKLPKPPSEPKINLYIKSIARIAGIKKHLTTHVGRHTFATRCAELGISQESTAELMGITVNICGVYYRITGRKLDQEIDKWDQ